jgi:hypothetical protein
MVDLPYPKGPPQELGPPRRKRWESGVICIQGVLGPARRRRLLTWPTGVLVPQSLGVIDLTRDDTWPTGVLLCSRIRHSGPAVFQNSFGSGMRAWSLSTDDGD